MMPQYPLSIGAARAAMYYGVEVVDTTPDPPVNVDAPAAAITIGTGVPGDTCHCTMGNWQNVPDSYAYQWQRGGTNIPGATGSSHIIVAADQGTNLTCNVTATNVSGSATASSNAIAIPAAE